MPDTPIFSKALNGSASKDLPFGVRAQVEEAMSPVHGALPTPILPKPSLAGPSSGAIATALTSGTTSIIAAKALEILKTIMVSHALNQQGQSSNPIIAGNAAVQAAHEGLYKTTHQSFGLNGCFEAAESLNKANVCFGIAKENGHGLFGGGKLKAAVTAGMNF